MSSVDRCSHLNHCFLGCDTCILSLCYHSCYKKSTFDVHKTTKTCYVCVYFSMCDVVSAVILNSHVENNPTYEVLIF